MGIWHWVKGVGCGTSLHATRKIGLILFGLVVGLASDDVVAQANLSIASFTYSTPVLNGSTQSFTVVAKNIGDQPATNARLRVFLPNNFTFSSPPTGCAIDNSPHTFLGNNNPSPTTPVYSAPAFDYTTLRMLRCDYATVAAGSAGDISLNFSGVASATAPPQLAQMAADFYSDLTEASTSSDNYSEKQITVNSGADLALASTPITVSVDSVNVPDGGTVISGKALTVNVATQNNGPDAATQAQVVVTLPGASNLTAVSVPSGSPWSCSNASNTVTCTYGGGPVASGAAFPPISIAGTLRANTTGAVGFNASIASPPNTDPVSSNNGPLATAFSINPGPGLDLTATKELRYAGASVSSVAFGNAAVFRIGISNAGPWTLPAAGAQVIDTLDAGWTLGTMPAGCTASGQTVTCVNAGALASGASFTYDIPVTAPASGTPAGPNVANVSLTSAGAAAVTEVNTANNAASLAYSWSNPVADLRLVKSKSRVSGSGPLATGNQMVSNIAVTNLAASTAFATGTITVKDTLSNFPREQFVSFTTGGTSPNQWACSIPLLGTPLDASNNVVTCVLTAPSGGYAPGAALPALSITTQADLSTLVQNNINLSNMACTGATADIGYTLDGANSNDCDSDSLVASTRNAVMGITKTTNASGDKTLQNTENSYTYTLVMTTTSGDTVPTLVVTDTIPLSRAFPSPVGTTGVTAAVTNPLTGESCSVNAATSGSNALVTCTLKNVAATQTRTVVITVARPVDSGTNVSNIATLSSPDAFLTGILSASDVVSVDPQTEIAVSKSANPTSARAGATVAFTLTVDVNGPDGANNLEVFDNYDATRFDVVGTPAISPNTGTCTTRLIGAAETGDAAFDGATGIYCNLGNVAITTPGLRRTISITYNAVPKFPYPEAFDATYINRVLVKTSSSEPASQLANNKASVNVTILPPSLDLSVTKTDLVDPVEWDDTATPPAQISYRISAISSSASISTARNVKLIDVPAPPSGLTMTYASSTVNGASTHSPAGGVVCTPTPNSGPTAYVSCAFADLPPNKVVVIDMVFNVGKTSSSPARATSFSNVAKICSDEGGPTVDSQTSDVAGSLCGFVSVTNYDATPTDNRISERTTILPLTDLHAFYKKPVSSATTTEITTIQLNQEFDYLVKVRNKGPVDSFLATVTDALPAGFRRTATAITVTPGSAVGATNGNTCTSSIAAGASGVETVTCNIGPLPADGSADGSEDATKSWVIRIPVKADPTVFVAAAQPYGTNIPNTVSIAPALDPLDPTRPLSKDRVNTNNSATGNILVPVKAKISGRVFDGVSITAAPSGSEVGINGVTITLTGLNDSGAPCTTPNVSTNLACGISRSTTTSTLSTVAGSYAFDDLPPGRYLIEETQPASHFDGRVYVGTLSIGPGPAGTASSGFVATGAKNSITNIALANNEVGSNYNFEEYKPVVVSGVVFFDANNDGTKGGAETGLPGSVLRLSGTSYTGASLSLADIATTGSGTGGSTYSFSAPPTNNAAGYTVTQITEPPSTLDGLDLNGTAIDAGSAGRAAGTDAHTVSSGLTPGATFPNRNFGELLPSSIAGFAYIDPNENATKDTGETVLSNVVITLSGSNDLGAITPIIFTTNTAVSAGQYLFGNLRPGTYKVSETQPTGLQNTGAQVGTPASGTATAANVTPSAVSNIVLAANQALINYNFGHKGTLLNGFVYLDTNRNGNKDTGEPGLAGVSVSLSGTAFNGQDVCTLVTCTQTTAVDGSYLFSALPASNGLGYTIRETDGGGVPSAVLSLYGDGAETLGSLGGTVGADQFAGVVLTTGGAGTGYNFGEWGGRLAGTVYFDADNSGTKAASGEPGIAGVKVTLSGSTPTVGSLGAAPVCSFMPAGICTSGNFEMTTDANGNFVFDNLPAAGGAGYTLTETHPVVYQDGKETVGTVDGANTGTASNTGFDATAPNNQITAINLAAGKRGQDYLFGEIGSSLSGYVYIDADNSGTKDTGEPGISGVLVTLSGNDSSGGAVTRTATTDANGLFAFIMLPASDANGYTLTETQPAGYLDGKETAGTIASGTVGTVNNTVFDNTATYNRITGVVLPGGGTGTNYLFGERGGRLNGFVYADTNNSGSKDTGEVGIAGVRVTLSGQTDAAQDVCTLGIPCVATTDSTGAYSFTGVPPGTYQLVETQTDVDGSLYGDGKETAGVAGGVVDNITQGSQAYQNTIKTIVITPTVLASSAGNVSGYLFGEVPRATPGLKPPILSGYVYFDRQHSRVRPVDGTLEGQANWTVVLTQNGTPICTVTSDSNGFYQFDNLRCPAYLATGLPTGGGFAVRFSNNGNNLPNVATSGGGAGIASVGQISGITLNANDEITEQNLPLDPAGVVYDALTRQPVAGAVVVISGPTGFDPSVHLIGGTAAQTQTTGTDGRYSFWLQNAFPTGTYTLQVTSPATYYPAPSLILPACTSAPLAVGSAPNPGLVQQSDDAPSVLVAQHVPNACVGLVAGGAQTTQYYLSFSIVNGVSAPVLNNHIPLDPVSPSQLVLTKTGDKKMVEVGDALLYTLTVRNVSGATLPQITIRDRLPAGFTFIRGTARVNGLGVPDPQGGLGPVLGFNLGGVATGSNATLTYRVRVGVGSQQGTGINTAQALGCGFAAGCLAPVTFQPLPHGVASNESQYKVQVTGGVFTTDACLLGKVFVDCNNNHIQDAEELGIPGVRLYFSDGRFVVTDVEGKYSRCGITPRSHVLTADPSTLPTGSRLTTSSNRNLGDADSLFLDLKNGELHRGDFIEGSCTNQVLEQVKARRSQGEVRSVETEKPAGPALRFRSKLPSYPQQGTDAANQPLVAPRTGASDAR